MSKILQFTILIVIGLIVSGIYLDFAVFKNHPFFNLGKQLGIASIFVLIVGCALTMISESRSNDTPPQESRR